MIVDFAVEDDDEAAVVREHRLVAGGRQVDDRQPPVAERDPRLGIAPQALVVGPAMRQAAGHGADQRLARPPAAPNSRDPAHESEVTEAWTPYKPPIPIA